MAAIPFTDREMQRAWRINLQASNQTSRTNAHRLLLFYAIECGLKAILMKRQSVNCSSDCREIGEAQHNINKLLDALSAGKSLKLPSQFHIDPINIKGLKQERKIDPGTINQMWRYGGTMVDKNLTDQDLETHLTKISDWIQKELDHS